ncbi:hypothetical protein B0I35DRAFT_380188, partial [Stachybotrys elegans]
MSAVRNQNFRLRGIPPECRTRTDVRELVQRALSIEPGVSLAVHSFAASPVEQSSRVATLSFSSLPDNLSDRSRNQWVVKLPVTDDSYEDSPGWAQTLVFDTHFTGFTPLHRIRDEDCHLDLIAISGLGGHAFGSFKERNGPFMWLRDALPLDFPSARILIYGYDTGLIQSSSFQNLTDLGKVLEIDMKGIQNHGQPRPIFFIGHSLGGLVIKETIVKLKEDLGEEGASILKLTSGFLFFGVPHQGMAIESLVPLVKDYPNRSLLESLNKNSALLHRLDNEFHHAFGKNHPRIFSFYETEMSPTAIKTADGKWELSGSPKVLVDVSSATYGSKKQHPINRNHSEMVKFSNQYDEIYTRVRTLLQQLVRGPPNQPAFEGMEIGSSSLIPPSDENIECLRSLSFREQDYRYNDIHSAKDSCEWLLEDSQYQTWMNSQRGLFWIKGNPGAGKSVVMKFAVTMMNRRKSGELVFSFFIHGRGMPLQRTPLGLFRVLLNSMLMYFPQYLSQLTERFNDRETRFGTYQDKRWEWSEQELREFMSEVLIRGTKNRPVAIYVDALDECGKDQAKGLLAYFKELMGGIEREKGCAKICFSSRHYPILALDTIPTISVEERNDKDIRWFLQDRLKEIEPKATRQQIETEILLKAHGGFQWVVLITDVVIDGNASAIKAEMLYEKLRTTPEALDELYSDILSKVTNKEKAQMVKLFIWVLFAEQPLSAQELREALATDKDMACTTISELRYHESWADTLEKFERHVRHLSRGLVEFQTREIWEQYEPGGEDSDREAQFVHQSAADYILGKYLDGFRHELASQSLKGVCHFEISRSCLRYLTLQGVLEGGQLSRGSLSARHPLLPYAVRFLYHHIHEVEVEGIPQPDLLSIFRLDQPSEFLAKLARMWKIMDPQNVHMPMGWPFVGATSLHVLAALGSRSALVTFLQKEDAEVDGRDLEGNTPLLIAIREGRQEIALELLNRSIEWHSQHGHVEQCNDEEKGAECLRNYSVDVNAKNNDGESLLTIALTEGAGAAIHKLIEAGADLEFFGQQTALIFYAIRNRDKKLLMKLLEKKVNLDGAVYFALQELSYGENARDLKEFVPILLEAGANTLKAPDTHVMIEGEDNTDSEDDADSERAGDSEDEEAILLASRTGQISMVGLLLSNGASTNSRNKNGSTPLSLASQNGHEAVVKTLLEGGADVNASDEDGWTSLMIASRNGHRAVVEALIANGADVNASNKDGWTSLMAAS